MKFIEENIQDTLFMRYAIKDTLFSGRSDFQKVEIVETLGHGKMLLNDDLVMLTERDEHIYHEMITHIPLFVHPNPRKVLVIGGGDGGTVREVLRHKSVEKCVLVEIDAMVVDACKKFIPQTAAILSDPRAEVKIADGVEFVANTKERFDLIIVDSTDPIGPAAPLFGTEFYTNVLRCLTENGVVTAQGESPFYHEENQLGLVRTLAECFPIRRLYNFCNMSYPGSLWSFAYAAKNLCPIRDFQPERVAASGLDFQYYNADLHSAAFALPEFMQKRYRQLLTK